MEGVCTLNPTVNGKESKLFRDIKKRVVTQEAAAFLYGIAQDDSIRSQFTKKSDFDSNNELTFQAFSEKFNISQWIVSRNELLQERREQGVINSSGNMVVFEDPDAVINKILEYNDSHDKTKMRAKWDNSAKGYVIYLDRVNIDNYKTSEILKRETARLNGYIEYLGRVLQKPVSFSDELRKTFANPLNTKYFAETIEQLAKNLHDYGKNVYLSELQASILLDLYSDSPFVSRIKGLFDDKAASVVAETSHMKAGDPDEMEPSQRELVRKFIEYVSKRGDAARTLASKFVPKGEHGFEPTGEKAVIEANVANDEYFGLSTTRIGEIINDLRSKYMIDTKIKNGSMRSIESLSDAAGNLMQMSVRNIERMRRLGMSTEDYESALETHKREYDKGKYLSSIAGMFQDLRTTLDENAEALNAALETLESGTGTTSLAGLNYISGAILNTLKLGSGYRSILESLKYLDRLDLDERDINEETKNLVKDTARTLAEELESQVNNAKRKEFEVLYAFYLPIWGGSDIKIDPEGGEHSLEAILKTISEDPNILDRLIYSLNESNDEALGLLHQAVLDRQRERDDTMRSIDFYVRKHTNALYKAGIKSSFMYEIEDGLPNGMIKNIYGITEYRKARKEKIEALREQNLNDTEFRKQLFQWEKENTTIVAPFLGSKYEKMYHNALREIVAAIYGVDELENFDNYAIDLITVPRAMHHTDELEGMSQAELDYYFHMMALKSVMQKGKPNYDTNFFEAPQMTNDFVSTLLNIGNNPGKMFGGIVNYFSSRKVRDDEVYEETLGDLLHGNGYKRVLEDIDGTELMRLPLFFTHKLKDRSNMSMDFSRTMLAMSSAAVNYDELNRVLDTLMLTKDWLINVRQPDKTEGTRKLVDIFKWGRDIFMQSVMREENSESGLIVDFYEKNVYGKTKKNEEVSLFGVTVKLDRAADWLTGFTSRTGLTVNILGSQANLLVGKLQMTIEGFSGEFFDLADMGYAEAKYFQLLMPYLMEYNSNNKSSLLGLLSDKFNVMEGYYEELKQKGFQISALGKILSNTNLFLLYGMGEHLLHNETMLAILHRVKVRHKESGKEMNLLNAYEDYGLVGDDDNKKIELPYYQFEIQLPDGTYTDFTKEEELKVEKQITYCNKTMHGAFGDLEKGMASRYAFGRLVMNFRQWMPGHYGRRFRTMHYDADLGEYRQGFYQSSFKFVVDTVNDLRRLKFDIGTHWHELSDVEQANIKRAIAETFLMVMLSVQNLALGEYKDKRGSWAYRNMIYQTKRMLMEVKASTPLSGFGPHGFIANIVSMLNSPVAAITTIEDIVTLMDFTKLFVTIEGGRYEGENLYMHNLKRRIPYIGQIMRQSKIGEEDYIFQVFE